ncbi:MAG: site-specific integrase [Proteobacteria bacterium]|nr:site-specific integrase [Pseudomonadota bacterium]
MPKQSSESVPILEGTALLVRRANTPRWQVKYRIHNRWIRSSTKQTDLEEAKKVAVEIVQDALYKDKFGLPVITRKFKSVAKAVSDRFKTDFENSVGTGSYRDYFQAIDNWLIPFFGKYNIASIENKHIKAFYEDRNEKFLAKYNKVASKTAINTHATALSFIFAEAVQEDLMLEHHVPVVKLKGYAAKSNSEMPRASFTMAEYRKLHRFMRYWVTRAKKGKFTDMRYLLRETALFLANSGIRYGTELRSIRWNNINFTVSETTGKERIHVFVSGKTIPHWATARPGSKVFLARIWKRSEKLKHIKTWDELLTCADAVFALPDGTVTEALDKVFTRMLKEAKLHLDPDGQARSLYSLRHFYITQLLYKNKVSPAVVARQCGTSIKMLEQHYFNYDHLEHADALSE